MRRSEARALLVGLGIDDDGLSALERQGFVRSERDKSLHLVFKLRYRIAKGQRVIYIGRDPDRAQRIQAALRVWQRDRRMALEIGRLRREVSRQVREQFRQLDPLLWQAGFRRRGREIRRTRMPRKPQLES
jgi:hypothetical protein